MYKFKENNLIQVWRYGDPKGQAIVVFPGYNNSVKAIPFIVPSKYNVFVFNPSNNGGNRNTGFESIINIYSPNLGQHAMKIYFDGLNLNPSETILLGFSNGGLGINSLVHYYKFKAVILNSVNWYSLNQIKVQPFYVVINKKENNEIAVKNTFGVFKPKFINTHYGHCLKGCVNGLNEVEKDLLK